MSGVKGLTRLRAVRELKGDRGAGEAIVRAMVRARGSRRRAAEILEVGSSTLYRVIAEIDSSEAFRAEGGLWKAIDAAVAEAGFEARAGRARGPVQ